MLMEVKAFSGPSFHPAPPDDASGEPATSDESYRVQTETYRHWIDQHHSGAAALMALTIHPDPALTHWCHGSITWTQLERALRQTEGKCSPLALELCSFLTEKAMAIPKQHTLDSADKQAITDAAAARWDKWTGLLDAATEKIKTRLQAETRITGLKVPRKDTTLSRSSVATEWHFAIWKSWIAGQYKGKDFWLTPYLEVKSDGELLLGFDVGFMEWDEHEFRMALGMIDVQPAEVGGVDCTVTLPNGFFDQVDFGQQVESIANIAVVDIVLPLLRKSGA